MTSNLNYAVIGIGACGGVVAGRLLLAGYNVHLLARSDYQQLRDKGMTIQLNLPQGQSQHHHFSELKVYQQASELPPCDVVILTVKAFHLEATLPTLTNVLKPSSLIMLMQNGLDNETVVAKYLPNMQIVTASWIKATKIAAGTYCHHFGDRIDGICYDGSSGDYVAANALAISVKQDFAAAGIQLVYCDDFHCRHWTKLVLNIPLFILAIKYNLSSNALLNNSRYTEELQLMRSELYRLAEACAIKIDREFIAQVENSVRDSKQATYPSMKLDFDQGRELELTANFSKIILLSQQKRIAMPNIVAGLQLLQDLSP